MKITPGVAPPARDFRASVEEMGSVFADVNDGYYRGSDQDVSRDTGTRVDFGSGGGGCSGPGEHAVTVSRPDGSSRTTRISESRLPAAQLDENVDG
ncbi:MAG: hypothetical protein HY319_03715 [Armatimonadetes bacterium]|nr:hypothetical protein [Armatimonadota bacterium]